MEVKDLHDLLLAHKPDEAVHDSETCPLCVEQVVSHMAPRQGGEMSTYTKEDLDRAVADAVAALQKEIVDLKAAQRDSDVEQAVAAAVAEAKAELDAEITQRDDKVKELQAQLDAAVLEAQTAKEAHDSLVAYLEGVQAEEARKAEIEALKAERIAQIKEVASFPDEYLEANAERYAAMSAEDFEAAIADWKAIASAKSDKSDKTDTVPPATAFAASRTAAVTASATEDSTSNMREVFRLNLRGIDPRTI